jgi:hypothetical protein
MAAFKIEVTRISYGYQTFEIEADSREAAEAAAIEAAHNEVFSETSAEYEIESVEELEII